MVRWTQKAADWQRAYCPTERGQDKWQQKSLKDYPKILGNARATLFESEKRCLMCRIHLASQVGALHTSTVQA